MQVMGAPLQKASQSNRLALRWAPFGDASFASQIAAIFALSVAIQLAAGWLGLFRADVLSLDYDEHEYWTLSGQILAGLPMELGRRTMLYPLLLAALRRGADNLWFVQSAIAIAAATAAPLLAVLVNKLARSGKAAILAGLGLAIWPAQIFFASSLYSETIALPAFLLFLILLPLDNEGARRAQWWQWAVAGIVLGITAHIRPMYQLFIPVLPFILWLDSRRVIPAMGRFGLVIAGFALVVLPWSIYVSSQLGTPTVLSANGGETLAGGFNSRLIANGERRLVQPTRSTWDGPGKWIPAAQTGFLTKAEQALPYSQQDRLLESRTISWIRENPGDAAYLASRKLTYMWGIYPVAENGWRQALLGNLPILLLTLLFVSALVNNPEIRRRCARLYLLPFFVSGIALISWGSWRFRLPADAGMIAIVAIMLAPKMHSIFRRRTVGTETSPCMTS